MDFASHGDSFYLASAFQGRGTWGLRGFSKPGPFSCLPSLGVGFQRDTMIKHPDIALDGFCAKGDLPRPPSQGHVEPERKPGAKRPRSPSSSPSRIPTLLPPGPACVNYFHTSDLFKELGFTNFRDFDLQMHRTPLHAKALAADCRRKINGRQEKKGCSEQDRSKVIFQPSFHSGSVTPPSSPRPLTFFSIRAPVCACVGLHPVAAGNGCGEGQSGAT